MKRKPTTARPKPNDRLPAWLKAHAPGVVESLFNGKPLSEMAAEEYAELARAAVRKVATPERIARGRKTGKGSCRMPG